MTNNLDIQEDIEMWMVYLRFAQDDEVKTYHVTAPNKVEMEEILELAEQHGLSKKDELKEYAIFISGRSIRPKEVPNFHFYNSKEFINRWQSVETESS